MNVASLTLCYPSTDSPHAGLFIQQRLRALNNLAAAGRQVRVRVVHAQPAPFWAPRRDGPVCDRNDPPCWHVPMPYLPVIGRPLNPWAYARAVRPLLSDWAARKEVDVIDAHFCWPDGVAAAIVARQLDLPYTVTLRGVLSRYAPPGPAGGLAYPWSRRSVRHALRDAAAVIAVSQSLKLQAIRLGIPEDLIHVVPNGVDDTTFTPGHRDAARDSLGRSAGETILITVGHLCRRKGFHRVLALLPHLVSEGRSKARGSDLRYVIVGADGAEGRFEWRLKRLARKLGVCQRVTFTGPLDPPKVATWLQAADLFVLPTTNEGWCNALAEALATGLPVVCSDVGGNREQIPPHAGLLVSPHDPIALRDSIITMLNRAPIGGKRTPSAPVRTWGQVAAETDNILSFAIAARRRNSDTPADGRRMADRER